MRLIKNKLGMSETDRKRTDIKNKATHFIGKEIYNLLLDSRYGVKNTLNNQIKDNLPGNTPDIVTESFYIQRNGNITFLKARN